ncbi:MAG: alpha/beta fold hydrolase [Chloroflexi bacterium]|nr:alpha/beta fold hydrolase [Chloroflexota bacterium]
MIFWLACLVAVVVVICWYGSNSVAFLRRSAITTTPVDVGLPHESYELDCGDGVRLHGWLLRANQATGTIVLCHGHGSNRSGVLAFAHFLVRELNVLALDLRGHGESGGKGTSLGHLEADDVARVARDLEARGLGPVGVLGYSMGAATAIVAAAREPLIRAVVADSPFVSLRAAIHSGMRCHGYPALLATIIAPGLALAVAVRLRFRPGAGDPERHVRLIDRPLMLIHGAEDRYIPAHHSARLSEVHGNCELWLVDGAGHCGGHDCTGSEYEERVLAFFRNALASEKSVLHLNAC